MERKNENEFLELKNYSNFLIDLGLNTSFFHLNDLNLKQGKIEGKFKSIEEIDNYIKVWQIKNEFQLISRNKNMSSSNILLLSEEYNFLNLTQSKKTHIELLEKMFSSIGQDINNFFIININKKKIMKKYSKKLNEILKLYFTILNPKVFINMCSKDLGKFFEVDKFNLNFDYFKIPSVSDIMKNKSLKHEAWLQLKLLKVKLNES